VDCWEIAANAAACHETCEKTCEETWHCWNSPKLVEYEKGWTQAVAILIVLAWTLAHYLLWRQISRCQAILLASWLARQPTSIAEASAAQLIAAARAKGEPFFTASVIHRLEEQQVDGDTLKAILEAEQVQNGPDRDEAGKFFDELFKELSSVHKIAAKQTLREWVANGVPKAVGDGTVASPLVPP
jgi:hypothetical protein